MSENQLSGTEMTGLGTPAGAGRLVVAALEDGAALLDKALAALSAREQLHAAAGDRSRLSRVLAEHGYAASTCDKYTRIVLNFLQAAGRGVPGHSDVSGYLAALSYAGRSNGTVRTRLCALRALFDKILGWGITAGIRHLPPPRPLEPATVEQVTALLATARTDQERHLVEALFDLGMMPHEVRMLGWRAADGTADDCDGSPCLLVRSEQPGEDPCTVPFTVQTQAAAGTRWLFQSPCGPRALSTRTLQRRIRSLAVDCGLGPETTCTSIRLAGRIAALTGT